MRIYLDNCVLNRPFDDQSAKRVRAETLAVETIFDLILNNKLDLVWSSAIEVENLKNPTSERRQWVSGWKSFAIIEIRLTENVRYESRRLIQLGLKLADAIHIAMAVSGAADYFVTTDDRILKRSTRYSAIKIVSPEILLQAIGDDDDN